MANKLPKRLQFDAAKTYYGRYDRFLKVLERETEHKISSGFYNPVLTGKHAH